MDTVPFHSLLGVVERRPNQIGPGIRSSARRPKPSKQDLVPGYRKPNFVKPNVTKGFVS